MMLLTITDAVISRGFNNAPAIHFFEGNTGAGFTIGQAVYDKKAENNTRWVNLNVIVPGEMLEQIRRMKLKEHSHINLTGSFDMRPSIDKSTGELRSWPTVRALKLEYATGAVKSEVEPSVKPADTPASVRPTPVSPEQLPNFTGFEPFGGDNPFYGEQQPPNTEKGTNK